MKSIEETIKTVFARKQDLETKKKAQRAKSVKIISCVSCACFLLAGLIVGRTMLSNLFAAEDYRILLDINPSIEISVDENGNVEEVKGLNEDGSRTLEGLNLEGESAEDALKTIIAEVVDLGYISEEANSVLVSIEGADEERCDALKEDVADYISQTLGEKSLDGAILVQVIPADDPAVSSVSETYGISAGKAQLINQIIAQNKFHTVEELSAMSIHELNLLRVSYFIDMENAYETGTPKELAYIGAQRATEIALADANVTGLEIEARLECRESALLYCVEFNTDTNDYRYRINAVTGEILSAEKIDLGEDTFFVGEQAIATVGENAALRAALTHAGMENRTLTRFKFNRDWVDGTVIYNLFFTDGVTSGRYVVDARTGDILQYSKTQEYHDRSIAADVIGDTAARQIALAKDGLIDGNVSKCEIILRAEGESYVYDLTYICNAAKYTVQVDAMDGTVLLFEKIVLKDTGTASVEDGTHSSAEDRTHTSAEDGTNTSAEGK